jgi:hypothetical protein
MQEPLVEASHDSLSQKPFRNVSPDQGYFKTAEPLVVLLEKSNILVNPPKLPLLTSVNFPFDFTSHGSRKPASIPVNSL